MGFDAFKINEAEALRDDILKVAPKALIDACGTNTWACALLCAESYFKTKTRKEYDIMSADYFNRVMEDLWKMSDEEVKARCDEINHQTPKVVRGVAAAYKMSKEKAVAAAILSGNVSIRDAYCVLRYYENHFDQAALLEHLVNANKEATNAGDKVSELKRKSAETEKRENDDRSQYIREAAKAYELGAYSRIRKLRTSHLLTSDELSSIVETYKDRDDTPIHPTGADILAGHRLRWSTGVTTSLFISHVLRHYEDGDFNSLIGYIRIRESSFDELEQILKDSCLDYSGDLWDMIYNKKAPSSAKSSEYMEQAEQAYCWGAYSKIMSLIENRKITTADLAVIHLKYRNVTKVSPEAPDIISGKKLNWYKQGHDVIDKSMLCAAYRQSNYDTLFTCVNKEYISLDEIAQILTEFESTYRGDLWDIFWDNKSNTN